MTLGPGNWLNVAAEEERAKGGEGEGGIMKRPLDPLEGRERVDVYSQRPEKDRYLYRSCSDHAIVKCKCGEKVCNKLAISKTAEFEVKRKCAARRG